MQLEHSFTVPRPADEVFAVLRDVERIAPCMPGATLDAVDGDEFTGNVKVKVGPMQLTYTGSARFVDVDETGRKATIEALGKETRGGGRASATVNTELTEEDGRTHVRVVTDLSITGRPAQFGRGVIADVGDKLIGQFAECLEQRLAGGEPPGPEAVATGAAAAGEGAATGAQPPADERRVIDLSEHRPTAEAIDLMDVAGGAVLRRAAPVAVGLALVALLVWLVARRR